MMRRSVVSGACVLLMSGTFSCQKPQREPAPAAVTSQPAHQKTVRIIFDPKAPKGNPHLTALFPTQYSGGSEYMAICEIQIGHGFPIAMAEGPTLFRVELLDGNDDELQVAVISDENREEKRTLVRDRSVEVKIGGRIYKLLYPSSTVASEVPVVSNSAKIFVTHKPNE